MVLADTDKQAEALAQHYRDGLDVGAVKGMMQSYGVDIESAQSMFERAAIHARNEGVNTLFIHALSENTAMLNIARSAGAVVRRDGPESQAFLELPAATFDSHMSELAQQQYASFDYQLKKQTRQLSAFLSGLQAGRDRGAKPDHKPEP